MSFKLFSGVAALMLCATLSADVADVKCSPAELNGVSGLTKIEFTSSVDGAKDFAYALPPSKPLSAKLAAKGPLWAVVLHGHGSKGDQLFTRADIKKLWLPKLVDDGFGVLAPNIRGNSWMGDAAAADLHSLLKEVKARYGVKGFVFVGGSMGGTSSLIYTSLFPEDVLACVALCPATDLPSFREFAGSKDAPVMKEIAAAIDSAYSSDPAKMKAHSALERKASFKMPLYIAHAEGDSIIPCEQSRRFAKALGSAPDFKFVEIPGGHHDSPIVFMPEGLDWIESKL